MQVTYEGGLVKGIETSAGAVALEHQTSGPGQGGTEVVKDETTGATSRVRYDDQFRVDRVVDAWGNVNTNQYGEFNTGQSTINGVLLSQPMH